jgi:hypothetical protein
MLKYKSDTISLSEDPTSRPVFRLPSSGQTFDFPSIYLFVSKCVSPSHFRSSFPASSTESQVRATFIYINAVTADATLTFPARISRAPLVVLIPMASRGLD